MENQQHGQSNRIKTVPYNFPVSRAQVSPMNIYNINRSNNFHPQYPNRNQIRFTPRPPFFASNQPYRYNINHSMNAMQTINDQIYQANPKTTEQHYQKKISASFKNVLSTEKLTKVSKDKLDKIEGKAGNFFCRMKRKVKRQIKKHPYITGSLLTCFSLIMFFNQNHFIRMGINNVMVLDSNGWFTKYGLFTEFAWANPPVYGRVCLYFFAIKNGQDYLKGAKPHLEEVGPFCIL